ncbi:MAG: sugar-binding domain-containing protein [Thermoguttaceae bacterium]|jgi:hypothetical protein
MANWKSMAMAAWLVFLSHSAAIAGQPAARATPGGGAAAEQPQPASVLALGGTWSLAADPRSGLPKGYEEGWTSAIRPEAVPAPVPGIIQQALPDAHFWVWYWRKFTAPVNAHPGGRYLLRFEAVDYQAWVWLNGKPVGGHEGPETPFTLDVTDAIQPGRENLLAVRVLNDDAGGTLPNRGKSINPQWMKYGGITGRVELVLAPAVRVESLYAKPDPGSGRIAVQATLRSTARGTVPGRLEFSVAPAAGGAALSSARVEQALPPGDSVVQAQLSVGAPHLWTLDDPYLYRVTARVAAPLAAAATDERGVRCGFRDFRVTAGYFTLNGKRIFLRSTHTGNHVPMSWVTPPNNELLRRDLLYAKTSGFNAVRFITCAAWSDQLDLCDEIGLMAYQETCAAWGLKGSPQLGERFDRSLREVILRDRNHPSFTILGLLNEEGDGPVFRHAVETLPLIRDLDDTRLVLLSSGRWDRQAAVGSLANPGSRQWEDAWSGDVHFYPAVPQSDGDSRNLRTLGSPAKPVFLSEYGIGSLMNVIGETRHYEQAGARPDLKDFAWLRAQAERLAADWRRLGMDEVYAFPEDMLMESQRLHARQRLLGFDHIRANPNLCGFNLTGMLDHGLTGEGLWTFWRQWKPGTFEATSDGWAPLRWCLFVTPVHAYCGQPIQFEAVLANEDVLRPGEYPVRLRVLGPTGVVWERKLSLRIPEPAPGRFPPFAVHVLSEKMTLGLPAGTYQFAATMDRGGAPAGGRLRFYLGEAKGLPQLKQPATLWGIDERTKLRLEEHGIICRDFQPPPPPGPEVILVGQHAKEPAEAEWKELLRRIEGGSTAVFLSPKAFRLGNDPLGRLPLATKGRCYEFNDWLYHKECVAKRHPIFSGLQGPGVMDWEFYGGLIGHTLFDGQDTPDEVFAAAFAAGYGAYYPGSPCPTGYTSGVLLGSYRLGKGRFIINAFRILESLGEHPAADRLMVNLIRACR